MKSEDSILLDLQEFQLVIDQWGRHFALSEPDPMAFLQWVSLLLNPLAAQVVDEPAHPLMEKLLAHFSLSVAGSGLGTEALRRAFLAWVAQCVARRLAGADGGATGAFDEKGGVDSVPEAQVEASACSPPSRWHLDDFKKKPWQVPRQIGPFLIQDAIGSGGMGVIFKGTRQGESQQVAAIKVLQVLHEQCLAAFKKEMVLVSSLQHPNIAHYLDHGMLSSQRPWLALEYVKGVPVDEWCAREKPTMKRLLKVFLTICEAVTYAQNNLIIHRDLKPSNILIQDDDQPKLLDFGIAAVLNPDTQKQQTLTGLQVHAMTPEYASPEQIRQERLTAATDVYSLGVLLYQMLTGVKPYVMNTDSPVQWHDRIVRVQIVKPSRKYAEVAKLGRFARNPICGDLDAICFKAMEHASQDRYENAAELAADLRRVRAGYPVHARNNTIRYRLGKYSRRHRHQFFWAATLFSVLILATASSLRQSKVIAKERDFAAIERDRAEKIAGFLTGMFRDIDPDFNNGKHDDVRAFDILENGRREMLRGPIGDPETRGRLLLTMGEVYRALGKYEASHQLLAEAEGLNLGGSKVAFDVAMGFIETLEAEGRLFLAHERLDGLSKKWFGNADPLIQSRLDFARGRVAFGLGRYLEANRCYQKALAVDVPLPLEMKMGLLLGRADVLAKMNRHKASLQAYRDLLFLGKEIEGETHSLLIKALLGIGEQHQALAAFTDAQGAYAQATQMISRHWGQDHPAIIKVLMAQAKLEAVRGNFEAAENTFLAARDTAADLLRAQHPIQGEILKELSLLYEAKGDDQKAEALLRQSYSDLVNHFGEAHPLVAECLKIWGDIYYHRADFESSVTMYNRTLACLAKISAGDDHPLRGAVMIGLARNYIDRGKHEKAETVLRELLQIQDRVYGEAHPTTTETMLYLTDVLKRRRKYDESEALCRRGLLLDRQVFGENHLRVANWMGLLAVFHNQKGELKAAKVLYEKAIQIKSDGLGADHVDVRQEVYALAGVLTQLQRWDEAEAAYLQVLDGNIKDFGYLHLYTAAVYRGLANLMRDKGDVIASRDYHLKKIALCEQIGELDKEPCLTGLANYAVFLSSEMDDHLGALTVLEETFRLSPEKYASPTYARSIAGINTGLVLMDLGRYHEAEEHFTRAYSDRLQVLGENHQRTVESVERLSQCLFFLGDFDRAEVLICRALAFREAQRPAAEDFYARDVCLMGRIQFAKGFAVAAGDYYDQALVLLEKAPAPSPNDWYKLQRSRAQWFVAHGEIAEADQALETAFQNVDENSPEQASLQITKAQVALAAGDLDLAQRWLDLAYPVVKALQNPIPLAEWHHQKARLSLAKGQPQAALTNMNDCLAIMVNGFGECHPDVLLAMLDLAEIQGEVGAVTEALATTEIVKGRCRVSRQDNPILLKVAHSIEGSLLARTGPNGRAALLLEESHQELLAKLGPNHFLTKAAQARQAAVPR